MPAQKPRSHRGEMSITLQLPEEIEVQLHRWAELSRQSELDIVVRALQSFFSVPPELREELEAWQLLGADAIEKVAPLTNEAW